MATFNNKTVKIDELPGGFYQIKLKNHVSFSVPRIAKQELIKAIEERGWDEGGIEIEECNLEFYEKCLKEYYRE